MRSFVCPHTTYYLFISCSTAHHLTNTLSLTAIIIKSSASHICSTLWVLALQQSVPSVTKIDQHPFSFLKRMNSNVNLATKNQMNDFLEPNREITSINNDASAQAADCMLHHHINNAPTKNRKRKCEEFTISQKLSILNELRTKKCSVPSLAQKHNTSRTTIYRWKKEEPRLNRLKRSNANSKRVSLSATTSSSSLSSRKTYNDEFTAEQKLEVLKECADNPMVPMKEIATRYGTHVRSVYRWRKDEERLRLLV